MISVSLADRRILLAELLCGTYSVNRVQTSGIVRIIHEEIVLLVFIIIDQFLKTAYHKLHRLLR